jgi:hypothetical protein
MANPRRTARPDQRSLFLPAPNRPQWWSFPPKSREVVVQLLAQLFRDHAKRQRVGRSDRDADDE